MSKSATKYKVIQVKDLQQGQDFKTSTRQRKWRTAYELHHWKEGDTERLKGKVLVIVRNCGQLILHLEETIFVKSEPFDGAGFPAKLESRRWNFLTSNFYKEPSTLIRVFNKLLQTPKNILHRQECHSGVFNSLEVADNDETRKILSEVIVHFKVYIHQARKHCRPYKKDSIDLTYLDFLHEEIFPTESAIYYHEWATAGPEYCTKEDYENDMLPF